MKTPLLFLCHRIPYPPNKGDKIRSFHLLQHLSNHFDIYLAAFVDDPEDWVWAPEVEKFCVDTLFLELNPTLARLRSVSGLISGKALSLPYYHSTKMRTWINSTVLENDITQLMVFSAAMAQYVMEPVLPFGRKVIDFVDVDSDKWQQYALQKNWPMSWLYRREGKLLLRFEREVAKLFDVGLFVSSAEAAMFRALAPESGDKVSFYNNGVNAKYFAADKCINNPYPPSGQVLVFTGAMDYWPNIDAVTWFARDIFPLLRAANPGLQFYIVGSNPAGTVKQLGELTGVTVTGRVEDVRPYLQHASAAVAPMRVARGVQNKVLEAMAMEKAVIVTSKGLEGIEVIHGEQVLVADSAEEYKSCVQSILEGKWAGIGPRARLHTSRHFNWDENLPEVVSLLKTNPSPVVRAKTHV